MTALLLLLAVLAVARLTRLIAVDKILEPFRFWLGRRWPADSQRLYLFHCVWCLSIWIAAVVVPLVWVFGGLSDRLGITAWIGIPALVLATSHLAGLLKGIER